MASSRGRPTGGQALRGLVDQVLEVPDLTGLVELLTRDLPAALDLDDVALLLWDRKLESFEILSPGQARSQPLSPGQAVPAPETRFLISEGEILETPGGKGDGVLLPLLARSGLVGMLVLGARQRRREVPFHSGEVRLLSVLASRSALALENHLYQRELIESERMAALGTMASMLAHDFRGPMTVIRGYAETLLDGPSTPEEVRQRARLIVDMVDRLERMTAETLDFARGAGRLARRSVDLAGLLEELASGIKEEFPALEVVRDFRIVPGIVAALDADKLRRVVGNIAANALDAMGGRGRLRMTAETIEAEDGGRLRLVVADEGPGVPEEIRDRLFEPFVTRGKKGGTGLGLAVARRFVLDHGGALDLLKEGPGARFQILLPLQEPSAPGIESRRAEPSGGGSP